MTDYDALVKMFRTCSERDSCVRDSCIDWDADCPYLGTGLCDDKARKAADAIEELSRIIHEYQKFDGFLAAHGMFKQDPMVPLPEPPKEET